MRSSCVSKLLLVISLTIIFIFAGCSSRNPERMLQERGIYGKKEWVPMLNYMLELHKKSSHEKTNPFPYEWEEIGPGYCYAPAFGHWDIVHQVMDALVYDRDHGLRQLYNDIANQTPSGMIPGSIWMPGGRSGRKSVTWNRDTAGHPPVWMYAVDDYVEMTGRMDILMDFFPALIRQIAWFENKRKSTGEGFFYNDILLKVWESGVDEGVRFDETGLGPWACIDATCHVYKMYDYAAKWARDTGSDPAFYEKRRDELKAFIRDSLYVESDKMFYDIWAVKDPSLRHIVYENLWPLITGCATGQQANALIDMYITNPAHFFTSHPISTVSVSDKKFELRLWRGPAWNSMTYWVARGCLIYGRKDAAIQLLEKALDSSSAQFEKTGTIWEFYHPFGGDQTALLRKPRSGVYLPSSDYLGHNPLLAMAKLYCDLNSGRYSGSN
jgi:putative isomerase